MPRAVTDLRTVHRERLARLLGRERARYTELHPRSRELFAEARGSLLAGVPMSWMSMWAGGHPLYFTEARGNRITDVDGHTYVDFCLGDTGAMTGPLAGAGAARGAGASGGAGWHYHHVAHGRRGGGGRRPRRAGSACRCGSSR